MLQFFVCVSAISYVAFVVSLLVPHLSFLCYLGRVPVSILYKSIAGRYRPVRVADGSITARYRFIKNASWGCAMWFWHFLGIFIYILSLSWPSCKFINTFATFIQTGNLLLNYTFLWNLLQSNLYASVNLPESVFVFYQWSLTIF